MKSILQQALLSSAVSLASMQLHAAQVVLTFDVTPTMVYEGAYAGGEVRTPIEGALTPFQLTYRFDTENPWLDKPGNSSTVYVSSLFHLGDSSATPYTAWLEAPLPPASAAQWPLYTQVVYGHSITDYDGPTVPQVSWENMGLNTGITWFGTDPDTWESTGYNRGINWQQQGALIARQDFHALDANEVIAWLHSNKGKTLSGAFDERVAWVRHSTNASSDGGADTLLYWRSLGVTGDAVLRDVSVVPEPSSWMLAGLGVLAVMLRVSHRQRSRN